LQNISGGFHCPSCNRDYPVDRGVVRFLDAADDFLRRPVQHEIRFLPRGDSFLARLPL
jgi:hypothetical protein